MKLRMIDAGICGTDKEIVTFQYGTPPAGSEASLLGADASHAWVSVFCPPFGWIDLDPTNDVRVGTGHIVVAWGRDFGDVSPLRGVIVGGGRHRLSVRVSVQAE